MIVSNQFTLDDLIFEIRWSTRRQTVGVTVDRDGQLILHVPVDCPPDTMEAIARDKQEWVYRTLARKDLLQHPPRQHAFIPGEGFFYLGRSHRLRIVEDAATPLRLHQGWFELRADMRDRGREQFVRWYRLHALPWIERRINLFTPRIEQSPASTSVLSLGNRWGSCSPLGRLSFHWRTILLPPRIAEYVIAHELVHLHQHRHNAEFWERLERVMPDWRQRADWLARRGAAYDL